jgi:hypothetical protein
MADRTLCLTWGQVARGREAHSLEVFNDAVGYYAALQEAGRIERFDVVLLTPNPSDLGGAMMLYGSHEQLDAVREDERFQRITIDAALVVDGLSILDGYANEGIAQPMARFQDAVAHIPQHAHA